MDTLVRDWLGTDDAGLSHLVTDADGRMRLAPQVRVDWNVFRALVVRAVRDSVHRGNDEAGYWSGRWQRSAGRCSTAATPGATRG